MARSKTRSFRLPHALIDALQLQLDSKVIDYDNINSAILGLISYQLVCGKGHSVTSDLMRMPAADQDVVFDFLHAMTQKRLNLKGQLLNAMIQRALGRAPDISLENVSRLQASSLLELAKRWQTGDESVWEDLNPAKPAGREE